MGLRQYHSKRDFKKSAEPRGRVEKRAGALRFVVQEHAARRLHYDFRLELDGTMKSWAIPKGPSMDPGDKRLAVQVEDHPIEYNRFEGVIPKGNYGAGTVMIWDRGTYDVPGAKPKVAKASLRAGLKKGHLHLDLHGQKIKGQFSLVRLAKGDGKSWLLIKKKDDFSSAHNVFPEVSVASHRTMEEISHAEKKSVPPKSLPKVRPMLATLVDKPFDRKGWLFELKWDGYRTIAEVRKGQVDLYSRNQKSFNAIFPEIVGELAHLDHVAILDGEVVALDREGRAEFQRLQNYLNGGAENLRYLVFDILHLDGEDLRGKPLVERKNILEGLIQGMSRVRFSDHVKDEGTALFAQAKKRDLEGIVAKDGASPYREGKRGTEWLKVKHHLTQEAVICGYTAPRGGRKGFGAVVLGVYRDGKLTYAGHAGTGFNDAALARLKKKFDAYRQDETPFAKAPKTNMPVTWIKPVFVCEVRFHEWTQDHKMRAPVFLGIREDKTTREVTEEKTTPAAKAIRGERKKTPPASKGPKLLSETSPDAPKTLLVGKHRVEITHPGKIFFPEEGITKGDVVEYYRGVASLMLPYLKDRPESLNRHPNGIHGESFYQKNITSELPDWVDTIAVPSKSKGGKINYILCQNAETLAYLANLGCIEVNPWFSRVGSLDKPDYVVFDLDPEAIAFSAVIETALATRKILDDLELESICKTSGKTGLHIFVPLGAKYDYDQVKQFAEIVANLVVQAVPEFTSVVRSPAKRQKKVYVDFLQNRRGQTIAAPYSLRPFPGATVSAPLKWSEVNRHLDPAKFTMHTIRRRVDKVGDLWIATRTKGADLRAALKKLEAQK